MSTAAWEYSVMVDGLVAAMQGQIVLMVAGLLAVVAIHWLVLRD